MSKHNFKDILQALRRQRMWINLMLGFSAGLPLTIVFSVVKIWMRRDGVDLSTIGMMSWVGIPYSLNFLMGPILDRFTPTSLGRRRSWFIITQFGLIAAFIGLSLGDPKVSVTYCALLTLIVSFFAATQQVSIDAYRCEILPEEELGVGSAIYVYGFRIAMLIAGGLGLWVVDSETLNLSFNQLFMTLALLMLFGVFTTFLAVEPKKIETSQVSFSSYVIDPFKEFFSREGTKVALIILSFIFFFKFGDGFASTMYGAYYVDLGYSNKVIAEVAKWFGFASTMLGLGVGAVFIYRFGALQCLIGFGILQALSTGCFALLSIEELKGSWWAFAFVVGFEDFAAGLGTVALVSFLALTTDKRYSATQYALFESLASVGKVLFGGFSGFLLEEVGYAKFFLIGAAMAFPGLILIYFMSRLRTVSS